MHGCASKPTPACRRTCRRRWTRPGRKSRGRWQRALSTFCGRTFPPQKKKTEGVRRGYTDGYLRKSIVADPLRRGNTGDNTPAAITVHLVDGEGCRITVAPKGFGSENMSQIKMLKPADGVEGFKKFVLDTVKLAGSNPCPPIVLGIGVGGSFDKVAYLAKKALLRPLDIPNPDPYYAALERELLAAVNETGIGPQGFGGRTTCLGLAIEQMPTHVAGLPVAVNVSCHVTRRASAEL